MRVGVVGPCLLLWLAAALARAEQPVARGPGAESCPDAAALGPTGDYRVEFVREGDELVARIRDASGAQQRSLSSRDLRCAPLARATRLALSLLLDGEDTPRAEVPHAVSVKPVEPPAAHALPKPPPRAALSLGIGAGALVGALRPVAPALNLEGGLRGYFLRVSGVAHAAYAPADELGPGQVTSWLLALQLRVCGRVLPQTDVLRVDACTGLLWGVTRARAEGYTQDRVRTRPWGALPLELAVGRRLRRAHVELVGSALVPLQRSDYVVAGLGAVYRARPLPWLLSLRWAL